MADGRTIQSFSAGFALATLFAGLLQPTPALGQSRIETTIQPPPRAQIVSPRRAGAPVVATDPESQTPGRLPQRTAPAPTDPDEADETDDVTDPSRAPTVLRPAVRDGDLAGPGIEAPIDGAQPVVVVDGPVDGLDATLNDQRDPADIAVFEQPPAGFDPTLFQIEIEPILDRRPARLFRFEPFDPIGIKAGAFVILPEAELSLFGNSNVLRSTRARSDVAFDVRPQIRIVSNWRAHAVEFRARGGLSYFNDLSSENDRQYTLESRGRLDISRRSSLEALVSRDVTQESRNSIDANLTSGSRSDVTTDRIAAAYNHRFNRLQIQLRGSVSDISYESQGGSLTRDYRLTEEAARATWEWKPTLFSFFETALNQRDYQAIPSSDGISRNSTGERFRFGVGFGNSGQRLRGEVSAGYGRQRPDDRRLAEIDGVIVDANLGYRLTSLTSLLLSARSDVTETTQTGSAGALSRQFGIEARHALQRRLIGTASLNHTTSDFRGLELTERELTGALGLEYFIAREATLFGRYQHTNFSSTQAGRGYDADEIRFGIRVRQ